MSLRNNTSINFASASDNPVYMLGDAVTAADTDRICLKNFVRSDNLDINWLGADGYIQL